MNVYFGIKLGKTFREKDNPHPLSVTRTLLEYFRNNGNLGIYHSPGILGNILIHSVVMFFVQRNVWSDVV